MLSIELQDKEYSIRDRWEEISLEEFIKLAEIKAPERLIESYRFGAKMNVPDKAKSKKAVKEYNEFVKTITIADECKFFPSYYGKVIKMFSTIPQKVINLMHRDVRESIYNNHLRHYVLSLFYYAPVDIIAKEIKSYDPGEAANVKIGKQVFLMPETLRIDHELLPNYRTDILTFSEAASIETTIKEMQTDATVMPRFCAIYLRKKGEIYSDEMVLQREPLMLKLDMKSVWQVFFCIMQHSRKSLIYSQIYSNIQEIDKRIKKAESVISESEV